MVVFLKFTRDAFLFVNLIFKRYLLKMFCFFWLYIILFRRVRSPMTNLNRIRSGTFPKQPFSLMRTRAMWSQPTQLVPVFFSKYLLCAVPRKKGPWRAENWLFGMCAQRTLESPWALSRSHVSKVSLGGQWNLWSDCADEQAELNLRLIYSITSMARTRMARLPWIIRTLFSVPTKSFQ